MSELAAICAATQTARAAHQQVFMATVVRVQGSSYRRPGARMLFSPERWLAGSISGGCLERDMLRKATFRTREQRAALVRYDSSDEDDLPRLGCGGVVDVLLERLPQAGEASGIDPLRVLATCLEAQRGGAFATVYSSSCPDVELGSHLAFTEQAYHPHPSSAAPAIWAELHAATRAALEAASTQTYRSRDGTVELLIEVIRPPVHLFVFGSGHDAVPLVALAQALGLRVVSSDRRERSEPRHRGLLGERWIAPPAELSARIDGCDRACAVVMSHDYAYDREVLAALLGSRALYIGVMGPKRRTQQMLEELAARGIGCDARDRARLYAPVGLALGAETPAEIALSVLAELEAVLHVAPGRSLRECAVLHAGARA